MDTTNYEYEIMVLERGYSKARIKRLLRMRIRKFNRIDRYSRSPNANRELDLLQQRINSTSELLDNWDNLFNRRNSAIWEQIRQDAFERDSYTCLKCGKHENLEGHHIKNFADNVDERYDVDNVATLCEKCHKKFHSNFGVRNTSKKQLKIFLFYISRLVLVVKTPFKGE